MFLYRKKNVLSSDTCKSFINNFETSDEKYPGILYGANGISSTNGKKSTDITFDPKYLQHPVWGSLFVNLVKVLETGLRDYLDRHSLAFSKMDTLEIYPYINIQRYEPGEGFYDWHCERATIKYSSRFLVWMIYLNDVTDRGETEFFYQHHFESAEEGKLIIWPSDWMFLHRGIPSPTQTKYILTGWFTMLDRIEK